MSADHTDKLRRIVAEAARLPAEQRLVYLRRACGEDEALHAQARALVDGDTAAGCTLAPGQTLDEPALPPAVTDLLDCFGEMTGTSIGRYKLLQLIGEGGFGTVYLAEQQHPVVRRVALKIIKLGMDTKQVIARFEAERQALALMDHPNIATVLDAGATDSGRPYFVMELVRGVPITAYCDSHDLTVRQRMELLIPVCQAVQHAHQKGIIHRDLKPTNVLISVHDGKPVPKVIDFGIAKAINQRLTQHTLFTEYNQMIGTPEYMSPEQAELSGLDVDTRTDIYALGVLMYELLTGVTPFDSRQLRRASLYDLQRMIRELDPAPPSTRLSTLEALPAVAARRRLEPRRLTQAIRGELDWIVMKCLEKDRTRRYESADALAADLERYLGDQTVLARPASAGYRLRKLARRHRAAVVTATLLALVLLLASTVSTWQAVRATRAQHRANANALRADAEARNARAEAAKQAAVTRFFNEMLASANPRLPSVTGAGARRDITVRRALDEAGAQLDAGRLADQPAIEAAVRAALGQTYRALGELLPAERHLRVALEIHRRLHGERHPDVAAALDDLAVLLRAQGNSADAEPLFRQALQLRRQLGAARPEVATSLNNLGSLLWSQGNLTEARKLYDEALSMRRMSLPPDHPDISGTLHNLASLLHAQGQFTEAEARYREALHLQRAALGTDHVDVATTLSNLAAVLRAQGKLDDAGPLLEEALDIRRRHLPPEHPDIATSANNLALLLWTRGRFAEADRLYRQALQLQRQHLGRDHPDVASSLNNLATLLWSQGRHVEAEPLYREALEIQRKRLGPQHPDLATTLNNLASVLHAQGSLADAEPLYRQALAIWRQPERADHPDLATLLNNLAALVEARGELDEAEAIYRQALEMQRRRLGPDHPEVGTVMHNLAGVLEARGALADAEALYRETIATERRLGRSDHPNFAGSLSNLALLLREQGRVDEAEPLVRQALAIRERTLPAGHWQRASSATLLGELLLAQDKPEQAESLLLAGYEGLKDNPQAPLPRRRAAIEALLRLYEARRQPQQAEKWRALLSEFDRRHPGRGAAAGSAP